MNRRQDRVPKSETKDPNGFSAPRHTTGAAGVSTPVAFPQQTMKLPSIQTNQKVSRSATIAENSNPPSTASEHRQIPRYQVPTTRDLTLREKDNTPLTTRLTTSQSPSPAHKFPRAETSEHASVIQKVREVASRLNAGRDNPTAEALSGGATDGDPQERPGARCLVTKRMLGELTSTNKLFRQLSNLKTNMAILRNRRSITELSPRQAAPTQAPSTPPDSPPKPIVRPRLAPRPMPNYADAPHVRYLPGCGRQAIVGGQAVRLSSSGEEPNPNSIPASALSWLTVNGDSATAVEQAVAADQEANRFKTRPAMRRPSHHQPAAAWATAAAPAPAAAAAAAEGEGAHASPQVLPSLPSKPRPLPRRRSSVSLLMSILQSSPGDRRPSEEYERRHPTAAAAAVAAPGGVAKPPTLARRRGSITPLEYQAEAYGGP